MIRAKSKKAMNGTKTARSDINIENADSKKEITGLTVPTVATVDPVCIVLLTILLPRAAPPPAIMAKAQAKTGGKSTSTAAVIRVPATRLTGTAMLLSKLST